MQKEPEIKINDLTLEGRQSPVVVSPTGVARRVRFIRFKGVKVPELKVIKPLLLSCEGAGPGWDGGKLAGNALKSLGIEPQEFEMEASFAEKIRSQLSGVAIYPNAALAFKQIAEDPSKLVRASLSGTELVLSAQEVMTISEDKQMIRITSFEGEEFVQIPGSRSEPTSIHELMEEKAA